MTIGRGTRRELELAKRAIRAARTHLSQARIGLADDADDHARWELTNLFNALGRVDMIQKLASAKPKRKAA